MTIRERFHDAITSLGAVIVKEIRQTMRDKRVAFVLVVAPFIQLILLGFAVNLEVEHVRVVVADMDHTDASRKLSSQLTAGDAFDPAGHVPNVGAAVSLLDRGKVPIAMVIPRGYSRDLAAQRPAEVQFLVDGANSNQAIIAQNAASAFVLSQSLAAAQARLATTAAALGTALQLPQTRVVPRVLYNPTLDSRIFFVPGVAATLLLVVILMVTAMGLAREKEVGTLEQVLVTPIAPSVLIAGKTIPYALIGLLDLTLVLAAGAVIFHVPLRGNLFLIFFAGALYLLTVLGVGLFISTLAANQQQAFMGAIFFILPAILLGGFLTPVANMPAWLRPVSAFDPVRHFVEILRAVLLKSARITDLLPQLAALAGIGTTVFMMAVAMLRRRLV